MDKQKIIDKVVKLLNLAEGSEYDGESYLAKEKAAVLMAKYDISISEAIKKEEFVELDVDSGTTEVYKHDRILINTIAKFNGVCYLTQNGYASKYSENRNSRNIYLGLQKDIDCSLYMIDIVKQQRGVAWRKHLAEVKLEIGCHPGDSYRIKWMYGFGLGVSAKLRSLTKMKEMKVEEMGLVVVDAADAALIHYKKENEVGNSKSRGSSYVAAGYEAGKDVSIHEGIDHSGDTLQLN